MFSHKNQRIFEYQKYKGTPLTIDGNMRRKQFRVSSVTDSGPCATEPNNKDREFKVIKNLQLKQKACRVQTQHKENAGLFDNLVGKREKQPAVKKRVQDKGGNRKSGIEYLVEKSPLEKIQKRKFTPSSEWFLKMSAKENERAVRHNTCEYREKDEGKQNAQKIAFNRRHYNLESNIVLG